VALAPLQLEVELFKFPSFRRPTSSNDFLLLGVLTRVWTTGTPSPSSSSWQSLLQLALVLHAPTYEQEVPQLEAQPQAASPECQCALSK
jgi:hypothetical protein